MPEVLPSWIERAGPMLLVGIVVVALGALVLCWQLFGRGPRRGRRLHRAEVLLQQGDWQACLRMVEELLREGSLSFVWQNRLWRVGGECHKAAGKEALAAQQFEKALDHAIQAARLLKTNELEARAAVIEAMLAEVRRLFAAGAGMDNKAVYQMIDRTLAIQSPCLEAHFWRGLCHLREGDVDRAKASLEEARGARDEGRETRGEGREARDEGRGRISPFIDPPLYLGALLLREGHAKEALRYLTEANRIDGNCPFVVSQLGAAMVRAGGDAQLAVRALQRALGPRGFQLWTREPQRAWVEGMPEQRSFVRRLASKHAYVCPLWGGDLRTILRQANTALGEGYYRLGHFKEAAEILAKVMEEGAPSLPIIRGLGLSLARLGQYDPAFKNLRIAHEMEEPKDRLTAGYLALCGARGTPSRPEDKHKNVAWAIQLVTRFTAPGDEEWADIISRIFAEARACELTVDADEQVYLCEHLVSVNATDRLAAEAYHHLMATHPDAIHSEYAWLFCRASQAHGVGGTEAPALFARTFAEEPRAREFFAARNWDFDSLELTYLERAAAADPGHFPAALGPNYAERGEALLLNRSLEQEKAGQADAALATAEVYLKLAPGSARAHDRLAYLCYQRNDRQRAADLLDAWHRLEPHNPRPLLRLAIIAQEMENLERCLESIHLALDLSSGRAHADIAFLGARLMLKQATTADGENQADESTHERLHWARSAALELLDDCLRHDPQHTQALWCRAALRWQVGDRTGLAEQAASMADPRVDEARFHLLAGVCNLAARDYSGVLEACRRVTEKAPVLVGQKNGELRQKDGKVPVPEASHLSLAVEAAYLAGWASLYQGDTPAALESWRQAADDPNSPSAAHAHALLGKTCFESGEYEEAIRCWQALDTRQRAGWKLAESLAGAVFLSALEAFQAGAYAKAAEKLREAGRLGFRDRRLGLLLTLCLVKAGQQALYETSASS